MRKMISDGSFDKIFMRYHAGIIKELDLKDRLLLPAFRNDLLPSGTPFGDKSLWFDPLGGQ